MLGGIGVTELLVILAIVVMLFGTKKLRTLGGDLGTAIKGFRNAMSSEVPPKSLEDNPPSQTTVNVIEGEGADSKPTQPK